MRTVPAVAGRAFAAQYAAQHGLAAALVEAFPGELGDPAAAALTGAFIGAVAATLDVLLVRADAPPTPDVVRSALVDAVTRALGGVVRRATTWLELKAGHICRF